MRGHEPEPVQITKKAIEDSLYLVLLEKLDFYAIMNAKRFVDRGEKKMDLTVFGSVHWIYLGITVPLSCLALVLAKKFAKTEKAQKLFLKTLALLLLAWILINRLSQVYRYADVRWEQLIPDSFCGMTSLVLALAVLFGKKDNAVYHFVWSLGLVGALITLLNPTFLDQGPTVFYLPTISGLLHHSLALVTIVALLVFHQIFITYKKWYCTFFGFTAYLTVGAFQISVLGLSDSFHIAEPILSQTPLTAWVMAPMYAVGYGLLLLVIELVRRHKPKTALQAPPASEYAQTDGETDERA